MKLGRRLGLNKFIFW